MDLKITIHAKKKKIPHEKIRINLVFGRGISTILSN